MEQTDGFSNVELSKNDDESVPVHGVGQLDFDNGFSASYIDPAKERKMMWKFDVRQSSLLSETISHSRTALRDRSLWPLLHDGEP